MAKSRRLTDKLREEILANVLKDTLEPKREVLKKVEVALADEIYQHVIGENEALMKQLPAGYFSLNSVIFVGVKKSGEAYTPKTGLCMSTDRLMPGYVGYGNTLTEFREDHPFAVRILALEKEEESLSKSEDELKEKVRPVLCSVTTLSALTEVWPEIAAHIPAEAIADKMNLPAVVIAEINQALALAKAA